MRLPMNLTRSSIVILDTLAETGPMYPQEIASRVGLAPRTVTLALRNLLKQNLCKKVANFKDMRKPLYHVDIAKVQQLRKEIEIWRSISTLHLRV
ncbi:MAG: MarR family transcriptional regulator [Candidatus Thorarchaeota archaeon]